MTGYTSEQCEGIATASRELAKAFREAGNHADAAVHQRAAIYYDNQARIIRAIESTQKARRERHLGAKDGW